MAALPSEIPRTFEDLVVDLLGRMGLPTDNTKSVTKAKRAINTALQDMHVGQGEKFPWAERQAILVTQSEYTPTSTMSVTQGSSTIVESSSLTGDRDGNGLYLDFQPGTKIIYNGDTTRIYEFRAVTSDPSGTMTAVYLGDTDAAISYRAYRDEYALAPDFLKPVDARNFGDHLGLPLIDRVTFRRLYPNNTIPGVPRVATIFDRYIFQSSPVADDQYQVTRILFHPPPSTVIQIPYSYVTKNLAINNITTTGGETAGEARISLVDDDDEPIVPRQGRHAIVYHALADWYRDRRDDRRSSEARGQYVEIVNRLISDVEVTSPRPRFRPTRVYKMRARHPYSGGGRFDIGSRFDRIEDR